MGYSSHPRRGTLATRLIANGHSLEMVQTLLGHAHLDHVAAYLGTSRRELLASVAGIDIPVHRDDALGA
ncbi:tyrosine-type recombinase/integrase [Burkholderia sp. Tr-860]|uniref:tyrosine-type recombinase/integrase n=1 Tax=unclassified Burkholderia TaxID=2613784 RepID=UPI0031F4D9AE